MIKPMALGKKQFPVNLIQGPLAGLSCAPFRYLTWKYSQPAFSCTEMISCKTLIHQAKQAEQRYIVKDEREGPVCFQLSGSDPKELAEATQRVTAYGADLVDLNCGCPVKKIRSKGAGSRLLTDPSKLYQLITAMKQNTHVPVSIKIRVEDKTITQAFHADVAKAVSDAGADFLIVHGRHWTENYETPCRYESIEYFVNQLKIPVIGNGDIACLASLNKMFATGCAGVMIGRAGVGQPWLIKKLTQEVMQEDFIMPSLNEISQMFIEHVEGLIKLLGEEKFAIIQARKFAKYYARGVAKKHEFTEAIQNCDSLQNLNQYVQQYFNESVN